MMFPSQDAIVSTFASQHPLHHRKGHPKPADPPISRNRPIFPAWSAIDDAKEKAHDISAEAAREFNVASQKAQAKAGKIEPWSMKYYAACTFGGLLACVSYLTATAISTGMLTIKRA